MTRTVLIFAAAAALISGPCLAQDVKDSAAGPAIHAPAGVHALRAAEPSKATADYDRQWREEDKRTRRIMNICNGC